ncbi:MAG: P-loop NTPase [Gammaproteobacteria bacterium]|nr:P-loop NTPase [Gammaproteobacteria bacterium]
MDAAQLSVSEHKVRCIAITGGKGGVGKTNISINLATSFSKLNKRVMLLDADFGLANVDVVLGLSPESNLLHVIENKCSLQDILLDGPEDIKIVPASSGVKRMANLNSLEQSGLISAFGDMGDQLDVMIIDTAAGISDSVVHFARAAGEVVVVVCDEPASIADAYALIKVLSRDYAVNKVSVISNQVESKAHGEMLFNQMLKVINKYLDVSVSYLGAVPEDAYLKKAVKRQLAVTSAYPRSRSSEAFKEIAKKMNSRKIEEFSSGNLEFFAEQLVNIN